MKKIISFILALILVATFFVLPVAASETFASKEHNLNIQIQNAKENMDTAHIMAECARKLGYDEDCTIIKEAQARWYLESQKRNKAKRQLEELHKEISVSDKKKSEYPCASQVWEILKKYGYSDIVASAIIGNMMSECGGQTLDLQWNIYGGGNSYYGLCQWSLYYNPDVNGCGITQQLEYLQNTIKNNMEMFGGDYEYFCSLKSEVDAAWYFDYYYERGAWASVRGKNATVALKYFTN